MPTGDLARVGSVSDTSSATPTPDGLASLERYVAGMARKRLVAGVLFRDREGRVLLVEPSYKPNWEIPGGAVEADESPWAGARRELAEELGWRRPLGRLLVVDHIPAQEPLPEGVVFVFDGGVLDERDVAEMVFVDGEILSASFHTMAEVRTKVKPVLADRLDAATHAVRHGETVLCEQGKRVG
ncbi:ADP-ribose pyrophosphatase YjhB, NUDIX family [Streptoalloteichus tenebrarius]|uniref:ADP-ribose pyrophosphatase YjhB, NUDIX family n=1 Tax=Streptoalloteichus tenebrarius (strain ATCC 17920 / DSM 40477 / JCM 4838 / CBS 697.72 / NBRC 16177 / NCIMB 11028 / NRRL B-12390 / A12253. 1 / ISP 5477) TaxID=1933 RepID=A0ABT1I1L1_STRSD|nr:ADP-ribose pyrophosphatase YjhB, NUDIX family [Streptoalloteichus tenebrarius]